MADLLGGRYHQYDRHSVQLILELDRVLQPRGVNTMFSAKPSDVSENWMLAICQAWAVLFCVLGAWSVIMGMHSHHMQLRFTDGVNIFLWWVVTGYMLFGHNIPRLRVVAYLAFLPLAYFTCLIFTGWWMVFVRSAPGRAYSDMLCGAIITAPMCVPLALGAYLRIRRVQKGGAHRGRP